MQACLTSSLVISMNRISFFVCLKQVLTLTILTTTASAATITEEPVSVSAPVGVDAQFQCAGNGSSIIWRVDSFLATDIEIVDRGITSSTMTDSGTIQSILTVPATIENNGTTVQCKVLSPGEVTSNTAILTVLPGIGPVTNIRFSTPLSTVLSWDPPVTAGVLSDLSYIVTVVNNNTGHVIVNDITNDTQYPLQINSLQFCQYFTINVTAFSSKQQGESTVVIKRIAGGYYDLASVSQPSVAGFNITHSSATFTILIQQHSLTVCPEQELSSVTYPMTNSSNRTPHTTVAISQPGVMNYTIYSKRDFHYSCDIQIGVEDRNIEIMTVPFSSYDVQSCDVHSDLTAILVECTFAINSTGPGVAVIQNEQSDTVATGTLHRLSGSDKGSVSITDLPAGDYRVRVFDQLEDHLNNIAPAYEHNVLISIIVTSTTSNVDTMSDLTLPSMSSVMFSNSVNNTASPSVMPRPTFSITATLLITAGVTLVLIIAIIIVAVVLYMNRKYLHSRIKTRPTSDIEDESTRYVEMIQTQVDNGPEPTYMEPITNFLPTPSNTSSDSGAPFTTSSSSLTPNLHYAQVQLSANPPALPAERSPVNYATIASSVQPEKSHEDELQYHQVQQSDSSPSTSLPAENHTALKKTENQAPSFTAAVL